MDKITTCFCPKCRPDLPFSYEDGDYICRSCRSKTFTDPCDDNSNLPDWFVTWDSPPARVRSALRDGFRCDGE